MRTYRATARREGKWWVVEVDGVGATQGRSTAEAQRMAADLVAVMEEIPLEEISVQIEFDLPGPLGDEVRRAKEATRDADQAQRKAAEKTRQVVRHLLSSGMSKQDAARILRVSPQRISQLVKTS
ncbi:hypothetical protein ACH347_16055 [Saccharopolyspora sp. 5N102]|uniref:hypothetical protein n=1 Tax=Saccharopolyspora sp. 5N102 TaxID=3375155 RepID=UPI0037B18607